MGNIYIHDKCKITGRFALLLLDSVTYFPSERIVHRVAFNIYGVDLKKGGLTQSEKYQKEECDGVAQVDIRKPFDLSKVDGDFVLFLPIDKPSWGLMDIREILSPRPDVNLSVVSPIALMPHKLHIVGGNIKEGGHPTFRVTDKDGSNWTLHCKCNSMQPASRNNKPR